MGILDSLRLRRSAPDSEQANNDSSGVGVKLIKEADDQPVRASSPVSDNEGFSDQVAPDVPFTTCYQYAYTIGKIQNSVDSNVANIVSRDWYFAPADPQDKSAGIEKQIEKMDQWESDFNLSQIFEYYIRDWMICGVNVLGTSDWLPMQLSSVQSLKRDSKTGKVVSFRFSHNGKPIDLPATKYIYTKFIDADRRAWGFGAFHSIFNDQWNDPDVKKPKATAAILRVMQQDVGKIHHKFASPRVIYGFENVNKEVFDRDVAPLIGKMNSGDRLAINRLPNLTVESVDGQARFTDSIDLINAEVDAGLQSSAQKNLTQPVPLGNSRVGDQQDDTRSLAIMEKLRRVMDLLIIPEILGEQWKGKIVFKWGKQDNFDYNPSELQVWVEQGAVSKGELRNILKAQGVKLDDTLYEKEKTEQEAKDKDMMDQKNAQRSGTMSNNQKVTEAMLEAIKQVADDSAGEPAPYTKQAIETTRDQALKKLDELA